MQYLRFKRLKLLVHRSLVRLARKVYTWIDGGPLDSLVRHAAVTRLREIVTGMSAKQVLAVVNALEAAGISVWLAGGWGVDALVGRQTRPHADLDLVLDERVPDLETQALAALAPLGFRRTVDEVLPGLLMPRRWVMDDGAGHVADLLLVDPAVPPFGTAEEPLTWPPVDGSGFSRGVVRDQPVGCLSVAAQLVVHSGYGQRPEDMHDMRVMCAKFGVQLPQAIA